MFARKYYFTDLMSAKSQNEKIIFGLKVKQLRQENKLSFSDLASASGLSISYLNEIEKGKKYPKEDKIRTLAKALGTSYEELIHPELSKALAPVGDLLRSNFLNELPLELFGIDLSKVVEIISSAPTRVSAFISTLLELSRNYALREENFYFGALRSYLELHNNYFEELEEAVNRFILQYSIPKERPLNPNLLSQLLEDHFGYTLVEDGLQDFPELHKLRSVYVPKKKQLLLGKHLTPMQRRFQFGKELGFAYLNLKERANTSSLLRTNVFEEVLNHSKATYFSDALLIPKEDFIQDLKAIFAKKKWDGAAFIAIMNKYQASPEMFYHRLTNILPKFFGLQKLFFLRFTHDPQPDHFEVDRELHLSRRHHPHGNRLFEHYCRRWVSLALLKDLREMQEAGNTVEAIVRAQRSRFIGTEDEYLCLTLARPAYPKPNYNVSVTLGLLVTPEVEQTIRFLDDPAIQHRDVNKTCERCPVEDCTERAAPPIVVNKRNEWNIIEARLDALNQ